MLTGVIDQYLPHEVGGHGEELRAILPITIHDGNHAHVGFVDQSGGLQGVGCALGAEIARGELDQFAVDKHDSLIAGFVVAIGPAAE